MALKRKRLAQRRKVVGHTQESLAEKLGVDRTTVVRWERGETEPQPWSRRGLADALDVSLGELDGLISELVITTLDSSPPPGATVVAEIDEGGDTTDRRAFTIMATLAGLGVAGPMRSWITSADIPEQVGTEHLRLTKSIIDGFEQGDAAVGGDAFCDVALAMHSRVSRWVRECSYSREIGEGLQTALGDLEAWIGWLALDAERRSVSWCYLQEAILRARLRDDPQLEVRAMASLALLIRERRPRESLQCAEAAQRISAAWGTPRLASLLHLRGAHAYAVAGDVAGFNRELAKAKTCFDRGAGQDDPPYIQFVSPLELSGIEGSSYLALNRPDRAARAFTAALESPEPAYRRNLGLVKVQLAEALSRQRDVTGASEMALQAVPMVTALRSQRTSRRFATLRHDLGTFAPRVPLARDFAAAYDAAVT